MSNTGKYLVNGQPKTFSSEVAFIVHAVVGGDDQIVGSTPAELPLAIPSQWWFVEPRPPVDMEKVRQEVEAQAIPGLKLGAATDAGLVHLQGLAALQYLDLSSTAVTDAGLVHLMGLTALQYLDLSSTAVTDDGLGHLMGLTGLHNLDLSSTMVTDAGLGHLKGLAALRWLDLRGTKLTDAGLVHLMGLNALQWLDLRLTPVTDAGLERLQGLTGLLCLLLDSCRVTDAGLVPLEGLAALEQIDLSHTNVTNAGLEHLKGLKALESLNLDHTQVTDTGLEYLTELTGLQNLNLIGTKVTDAGLEHLKGLRALQGLYLAGTKVTDAGLEHLKGLTALRRLDLGGTKVTDEGLEILKGLPALQALIVAGMRVTDVGLEHLRKSLPNLEVMREPGLRFSDQDMAEIEAIRSLLDQGFRTTMFLDKLTEEEIRQLPEGCAGSTVMRLPVIHPDGRKLVCYLKDPAAVDFARGLVEEQRAIIGYDLCVYCSGIGPDTIHGRQLCLDTVVESLRQLKGWDLSTSRYPHTFEVSFKIEGACQAAVQVSMEQANKIALALSLRNRLGFVIGDASPGPKFRGQPFSVKVGLTERIAQGLTNAHLAYIDKVWAERDVREAAEALKELYCQVSDSSRITVAWAAIEHIFRGDPQLLLTRAERQALLEAAEQHALVPRDKLAPLDKLLGDINHASFPGRNERVARAISKRTGMDFGDVRKEVGLLARERGGRVHALSGGKGPPAHLVAFVERVLWALIESAIGGSNPFVESVETGQKPAFPGPYWQFRKRLTIHPTGNQTPP